MAAVVVVSGDGTGIGRAAARAVAADGSHVLILGRRLEVLERTAVELGAETVPGYTPDTELFGSGMPQALHDRIVSRIALGRAGRAADVAGVIRFLVSPEASFVTSQVIDVAGGVLPPNM